MQQLKEKNTNELLLELLSKKNLTQKEAFFMNYLLTKQEPIEMPKQPEKYYNSQKKVR